MGNIHLNAMKLKAHELKYGILTADEALALALEAEDLCKQLGPFDIAYPFFCQQKIDMEKYAYLIAEEAGP